VNVGGTIGPILALPVRQQLGIAFVPILSASTTAGLFALTWLLFRDDLRPAQAERQPTMGDVLKKLGLVVIKNPRFVVFLVIFSGFWMMFWHIFLALTFYVRDALHVASFELITTVDALTIIFVTVPATALAKRLKPIEAMTLGFVLASASWFLMAAVPTITVTVAAVAVFALGEAIQAPRFYEYVADLAPEDQVGTYMGLAFLPIALGSVGSGISAGRLVAYYVTGPGRAAPQQMWLWVGAIGVVSTALMLAYDHYLAPRQRG
jgi:POT family proton-dependent oligopeptide transporter